MHHWLFPLRFLSMSSWMSVVVYTTFFAPVVTHAQTGSDPGEGAVAIVTELAEQSTPHLALARGVIKGVNNRWRWSRPGIVPAAAKKCAGDDACLIALTKSARASHLLIIATAPLDETQMVASVRVYRTRDGAEIYSGGELISFEADVERDGAELLGLPLSRARGLPSNGIATPAAEGRRQTPSGFPSPLVIAGAGLMGAGVVVGAGIGVAAALGAADSSGALEPELLTAVAASVTVAGAAAGVALVTVAALIE